MRALLWVGFGGLLGLLAVFVLGFTLPIGVGQASISMTRIFTLEQQAAARYREAQDLSSN